MAKIVPQLQTQIGLDRHRRRMTELSVMLPFGYLVTFSIETNHPDPRAKSGMRHLSVSSPNQGKMPNAFAIWMVAELLGFEGESGPEHALDNLRSCYVCLEDAHDGCVAVNIVQPLSVHAALVGHA
jgi:hypothetical protein